MAIRPTEYPRWATVPSVDPVVGGANVVEPPSQQKDTGWQRKQKPPANYQNWLHNLTYQWLLYLDEGGADTGDVKATYRKTTNARMEGVWVIMNDGSIGNAGSGASTRANIDTEQLFIVMWDNVPNTYCPVSGGRGASGTADFAAGKTLTLPASLGRAMCNIGGSPTAYALGQSDGAQTHQLTIPELAAHSHDLLSAGDQALHSVDLPTIPSAGDNEISAAAGGNVKTTTVGSDTAHNNIQPSMFLNVFIKL